MGSGLRHDKLTEIFSIRIPAVTKAQLDKLSTSHRNKLNDRILVTIAQVLHDSQFDPSFYLCEVYTEGESGAT